MTDWRIMVEHQFVRFLLVGTINSLFGYGCFALFLYMGFHYTLSLFFATVLGVLFNFKSIGSLVFRSHDNRLIFRFVGSYVVVYCINVIGIKSFFSIGVTPYISGAILILPMAILAYMFNKRFVFNNG
jgi:putative flippase GtrA